MGKSLSDKIKELPLERQKKIETRAQELIAQEIYRSRTRQHRKKSLLSRAKKELSQSPSRDRLQDGGN